MGRLLTERAPEDKRAEVVQQVADAYASRAVESETSEGTVELSVTVVSAANLANDKKERSQSDPYCQVTLVVDGEDINTVKTSHVWNDLSPEWNETFSFDIDAAKVPSTVLRVEMTDYDSRGSHEALGSVDASIAPRPGAFLFEGSGGRRTFSLVTAAEGFDEPQGSVTLAWVFTGDAVDDARRIRDEAQAKRLAEDDAEKPRPSAPPRRRRAAALAAAEEEQRLREEEAIAAAEEAAAQAEAAEKAAARKAEAEATAAREAAAAEAKRLREAEEFD